MKIRVLGCSGGQAPGHHLSSYLVNDTLLIDAGAATSVLDLKEQRSVKNVLITHTHLDHVLGLATLADNLFGRSNITVRVRGIKEVVAALRSSFFNDILWPDFTRMIGNSRSRPVMAFHVLPEEKRVKIGDVAVTAVRVHHVVPSVAFFIEEGRKTLLHVGDTGPTDRLWHLARRKKGLCAVIIEASFPNRLQETADVSLHLTPQTLAGEIEKFGRPSVPVFVTHLKPQYRQEIIKELGKLERYRIRVLKEGDSLRL